MRVNEPSRSGPGHPPGRPARQSAERTLLRLLLLYAGASLAHFAHNALELHRYPHMPAWLTASEVMGAWLALSALGAAGYWLYRKGSAGAGLALMGLYGLCGLDALAHYLVAPFGWHSGTMLLSILAEALTGCVLAGAALRYSPVLMRVQVRVRKRA